MSNWEKVSLFLLRVSLGWLMFYAGITKVLNPAWSAGPYLQNAKTFTGFYQWLASPPLLPAVNFLNEWGLTLLGVSLILGIFVRFSSLLGILLMMLYYLAALSGPYPDSHSFIVDQHIIFSLVLSYLAAVRAGRVWGLEPWCSQLPICRRISRWREWLG